jgi:hypothetical protein
LTRAAAAELLHLLNNPVAMASKLKSLAAEAVAEIEASKARLDEKLEAFIAAKAESNVALAAREHAVSLRESAVTIAERDLAAEQKRVADRERAIEFRAADLGQRARSIGA